MSELGGVRTGTDDGEVWGGHESPGRRFGRHLEHPTFLFCRNLLPESFGIRIDRDKGS